MCHEDAWYPLHNHNTLPGDFTSKAFPFAIPTVKVSKLTSFALFFPFFFSFFLKGNGSQGVGTPCKPESAVHLFVDNFNHFCSPFFFFFFSFLFFLSSVGHIHYSAPSNLTNPATITHFTSKRPRFYRNPKQQHLNDNNLQKGHSSFQSVTRKIEK